MAHYAFINPVVAGKVEAWKGYIKEMEGPRKKEYKESRKKVGLSVERVWLQHTPMGDFAVVYWKAKDIGKVFEGLVKSDAPFDKWFRDKILLEVHGMDFSKMPPMNELILDFKD
ncbi:MAG: hypothetical protein ABSG90_05715 [Dehalococcoidia bacterium]|jgi:hypothetical protein